jgi:recombination DNA repair RAD52 pathway protein
MTGKDRAEIIADLGKSFPKSAVKKHPKKGFDYIEGHTVINRLNAATDNCWDFEVKSLQFDPVGVDKNGQPITKVLAHVAITIDGLGRREHIGVQTVYVSGEDLVKGAITDALKKCATLFGPGLELYGSDYEAEATVHTPQRATLAPNAPNVRHATVDTREAQPAAQGNLDREKVMRALHATGKEHGLDHDALSALIRAKGHESMSTAPVDALVDLGKAIKADPAKLKGWLAKQSELLPDETAVPTRTAESFTR